MQTWTGDQHLRWRVLAIASALRDDLHFRLSFCDSHGRVLGRFDHSFSLQRPAEFRELTIMRNWGSASRRGDRYQRAVASCRGGEPSRTCPDCETRFRQFYTGDPNGDIRQGANGIVTSECLKPGCCWFHVGCAKCVPKKGKCNLVGHYCGIYVWVGPEGRDELSKLTLAILDYAFNAPPMKRQKEVVYNLDVYGLPTSDKSVAKVTATIAIDEQNESLLNISQADAARIEERLDYRLNTVRNRLSATQDADEKKALRDEEQTLMDKLDFLHERLRAGGLKEKYYPQPSLPAGTGAHNATICQYVRPTGWRCRCSAANLQQEFDGLGHDLPALPRIASVACSSRQDQNTPQRDTQVHRVHVRSFAIEPVGRIVLAIATPRSSAKVSAIWVHFPKAIAQRNVQCPSVGESGCVLL